MYQEETAVQNAEYYYSPSPTQEDLCYGSTSPSFVSPCSIQEEVEGHEIRENNDHPNQNEVDDSIDAHLRNIIVTFESKNAKMNMILNGKRMKKNQKQMVGVPVFLPGKINQRDIFELFGGIDISTVSNGASMCTVSLSDQCRLEIRGPPIMAYNKITRFSEAVISSYRVSLWKFEFVIDILEKSCTREFKELGQLLRVYQSEVDKITSRMRFFENISSALYAEIQEDYERFVQNSLAFVGSSNRPGVMMKYVIGRMNYLLGDIQITRTGLSESYLQLIGLTHDLYTFAQLRGIVSDICPLKRSNVNCARQDIMQRIYENESIPIEEIEVVTIDGFKLTLLKKFRKIVPLEGKFNKTVYDYIFYIEEFEVSQNQLNALAEYRRALVRRNLANNNNSSKSMDIEFTVHKELSGFFEHVEYSVYSQLFLEKFYAS